MIKQSYIKRAWIYQQERFPIFKNGLLILTFTFSAASFSRLCRGEEDFIDIGSFGIGFITTFIFFLLLRLLDEFKDADDDAQYRPYRPVPRGLVSFSELRAAIIFSVVLIITLNYFYAAILLVAVGIVFFYLYFMTREFFVPQWLKARPMMYMATHMLIMPLIDIYTTGLDWLKAGLYPPEGVEIFLMVSFFNGMVIEIGRKIRAPQEEEKGVQTYSADHGLQKALLIWTGTVTLTYLFALWASTYSTQETLSIILLTILFPITLGVTLFFYRNVNQKSGTLIENMAGIWTLGMYLILGGTPMIVNWLIKILR